MCPIVLLISVWLMGSGESQWLKTRGIGDIVILEIPRIRLVEKRCLPENPAL